MKTFTAFQSLLVFFILILSGLETYATHNRSGEITYTHISGTTYKFRITTYTRYDPNNPNLPSNAADRPTLDINYGDGVTQTIPRVDSSYLGNEVRKNVYEGTHTYSGSAVYNITVEDPNRNADILNISDGKATDMIAFSLRTTLFVSPFIGGNDSPVLTYPPVDNACINKVFYHNPTAIDPDGDSLSYHLVTPLGANMAPVPGYYLPNLTTINVYGDMKWSVPSKIGLFNFAILIKEWRKVGGNNGDWQEIGSVLRDLQVNVKNCDNDNPVLTDIPDTCVEAGTFLTQTITAVDPGQNVTLLVNGAPFQVLNHAQFIQNSMAGTNANGTFEWNTACNHVRKSPYQVYIKAKDDDNDVPLLDVGTWNITVVGPSPKNPSATALANSITLSWDQSACSEVERYDIYRRNGSYGFVPSHCETGVPSYTGYTLLTSVQGLSNTTFIDDNNGAGLVHGHDYCYMIVGIYPDGAESYASEEVCARLTQDVPIITNVSVKSTGNPGVDSIAWASPRAPFFNDTAYPGPYRYLIYRSTDLNGNNLTLIDSTALSPTLDDTNYVDITVNSTIANSYRIVLYDYSGGGRQNAGSTNVASSVFLSSTSTDNQINLSWTHNVPWMNQSYTIYRKSPGASVFDSLTTTTLRTWADTGLVNGKEYCYYVESTGSYSISGLVNPIINLSQQLCAVPVDNIPPCAPELTVNGDCKIPLNTLTWNNPNLTCSDDVIRYEIFYKPTLDGEFFSLMVIDGATTVTTEHVNDGSIAGCYYMVSIDSAGNKSVSTDTICIDNCPNYELPNVYTPDGDGVNDFFHPLPYMFVESIDLTIFNRWGQPVFQTTDPDINWDGLNQETGSPVSEGVYYYVCTVNEKRLAGIVPRTLTGFVHLFRGQAGTPKAE